MADHPRRNYPYYRRYEIPKSSGGKRIILAPRTYLKAVQKYILRHILERQPVPRCVMGFVKGRGVHMNASIHASARYLLNVDIKDFFPSVKKRQVMEIFRQLGFPEVMTRVLAQLCTYGDALPQGAPTSPYLANLALCNADREILRICRVRHLKYSRYADDLTFSGETPIDTRFLKTLTRVLGRYGFVLNSRKVRFSKPGQAKYVTGFVVNQKAQPSRRTRRLLRAMFHRAFTHPAQFRDKQASLAGWASYVNSYDEHLGSRYLRIAKRVSGSHR